MKWGITKPPVHGWCFSYLMDQYEFEQDELLKVYYALEKWTNWWLTYRDSDRDGIPEYPQGCDSGWDNATVFDDGYFMETPDLPAFLILQMNTLGRIADKLATMESGEWKDVSQVWKEKAENLLVLLYEHSWDGNQFLTKQSGTHEVAKQSECLLSLMPLVLGNLLDEDKRAKLIEKLKKDFLTEYGLASEAPESKLYQAAGYWRGPIWAPATYLIIDGLKRCGEKALAKEIALRFCHMLKDVAKGNYENFDALTGQGLCSPGYTWTASVYMLLCWEYDEKYGDSERF